MAGKTNKNVEKKTNKRRASFLGTSGIKENETRFSKSSKFDIFSIYKMEA